MTQSDIKGATDSSWSKFAHLRRAWMAAMSCADSFRSRRPPAVAHRRAALGRHSSGQRQSVDQESSPHPGGISALPFPGCLRRSLPAAPDDFVHLRLSILEQGTVWLSPLKCPVARSERCSPLLPLAPHPGSRWRHEGRTIPFETDASVHRPPHSFWRFSGLSIQCTVPPSTMFPGALTVWLFSSRRPAGFSICERGIYLRPGDAGACSFWRSLAALFSLCSRESGALWMLLFLLYLFAFERKPTLASEICRPGGLPDGGFALRRIAPTTGASFRKRHRRPLGRPQCAASLCSARLATMGG